jgi:hypothetical protein
MDNKIYEIEDLFSVFKNTIFEDLAKSFNFFLLSVMMAPQPALQNIFLQENPGSAGMVGRFNKDIDLHKDGDKYRFNAKSFLIFQGRVMAIMLFNTLENCKYNKYLNSTDLFRFAKHLRNGAAHNNRFTFDRQLEQPVIRKDKVIDNNLQGKEVFLSFITVNDLIYLMVDIIELIKSIEIKLKATNK